MSARFSVVIPTMQRATHLPRLLRMLSGHPLVREVIVINNSTDPLHHESPKVRVLDQGRNIYVNPAWNLGAKRATSDYLCICNDDILFQPALIDFVARHIGPRTGLIGPSPSVFKDDPGRRPMILPAYRRSWGFGTLMFLPRHNYVPVPHDLRIYCGDNWLFEQQRGRCYRLVGTRITTDMSTTSASGEFSGFYQKEKQLWFDRYAGTGPRSLVRSCERALFYVGPRGLRAARQRLLT